MSKDSTKNALENYYRNLLPKTTRKRGVRNKSPEKQVEHDCLAWMRERGWDVQIYEAKAVYHPGAGRYLSQRMKAGTVDCQGILPSGTFVAVEFKAPGRLSTFNSPRNTRQKDYLIQKINSNAFGAVVDSANRLAQIFHGYTQHLKAGANAKAYLLSELP